MQIDVYKQDPSNQNGNNRTLDKFTSILSENGKKANKIFFEPKNMIFISITVKYIGEKRHAPQHLGKMQKI